MYIYLVSVPWGGLASFARRLQGMAQNGWRGGHMPRTRETPTISLYIPQKAQALDVVRRLQKLGEKRDRSLNYLIVEAILQYLEREGT